MTTSHPGTSLIEVTLYLAGRNLHRRVVVIDGPGGRPEIAVTVGTLALYLTDRAATASIGAAWRSAITAARSLALPATTALPPPAAGIACAVRMGGFYTPAWTVTSAGAGRLALRLTLGGLTVIIADSDVLGVLADTWALVDRLALALYPEQDVPTLAELSPAAISTRT